MLSFRQFKPQTRSGRHRLANANSPNLSAGCSDNNWQQSPTSGVRNSFIRGKCQWRSRISSHSPPSPGYGVPLPASSTTTPAIFEGSMLSIGCWTWQSSGRILAGKCRLAHSWGQREFTRVWTTYRCLFWSPTPLISIISTWSFGRLIFCIGFHPHSAAWHWSRGWYSRLAHHSRIDIAISH